MTTVSPLVTSSLVLDAYLRFTIVSTAATIRIIAASPTNPRAAVLRRGFSVGPLVTSLVTVAVVITDCVDTVVTVVATVAVVVAVVVTVVVAVACPGAGSGAGPGLGAGAGPGAGPGAPPALTFSVTDASLLDLVPSDATPEAAILIVAEPAAASAPAFTVKVKDAPSAVTVAGLESTVAVTPAGNPVMSKVTLPESHVPCGTTSILKVAELPAATSCDAGDAWMKMAGGEGASAKAMFGVAIRIVKTVATSEIRCLWLTLSRVISY